jgi:hypothetical protein
MELGIGSGWEGKSMFWELYILYIYEGSAFFLLLHLYLFIFIRQCIHLKTQFPPLGDLLHAIALYYYH